MTADPKPLKLILTRHAKSAWDDPLIADHDRPLNRRGRLAAMELGQWLASRGYIPDTILCSDALRTRETWEIVSASLPAALAAEMKPSLYHASPDTMLAILQNSKAGTVMILGHNPGIAALAALLPAIPPADPEFERFPTAATLVAEFAVPVWADISTGSAQVLDFFLPTPGL